MTIRTPDRRTLVYLALIAAFVLMVLARQAAIRQERRAEIVSILNEWQRHGKPVRVEEVSRSAVAVQVKVTLQPSGKAGLWQGFITQDQRRQLAVGQPVSCLADTGCVLGSVTRIADSLDLASGMFAVDVTFDKPGQNVEPGIVAYIDTQTFANVIAVDDGILERGAGSEQFAWVVRDGKAHKVPVLVGSSNGFGAIVTTGLSDGDKLIVAGQTQLQPGDTVDVLSADDAPAQEQGTPQ